MTALPDDQSVTSTTREEQALSQDENTPDSDAEEQAEPDADDHGVDDNSADDDHAADDDAGHHRPPGDDAHDTVDGSRLVAGTEGAEGGPDDARDEGLGQK